MILFVKSNKSIFCIFATFINILAVFASLERTRFKIQDCNGIYNKILIGTTFTSAELTLNVTTEVFEFNVSDNQVCIFIYPQDEVAFWKALQQVNCTHTLRNMFLDSC